jgi:uncharacterized membrane protein
MSEHAQPSPGLAQNIIRLLGRIDRLTLVSITLFGAMLAAWWWLMPGGLLGLADGVGYAVCHRIAERSFQVAGRQMPMCARCTGTFLGGLVGLVVPGLAGRRKAGRFPPLHVQVILVMFMLAWAFDGANSYSHLLQGTPRLYQPQNWLRLVTGTFHGLAIGSLALPAVNATWWSDVRPQRTINGLRELGGLMLACAALIGLVLSGVPAVLYVLGLLSAVGVLTLMGSVDAMLIVMILRRENSLHTWREAVPMLLLGVTAAMAELGIIDIVRYTLTGTWGGFVIPGA